MTKEEHIRRHLELHHSLDELVADFIMHNHVSNDYDLETTVGNLLLSDMHLLGASILDLIHWSFQQTTNPSDEAYGDEAVNA